MIFKLEEVDVSSFQYVIVMITHITIHAFCLWKTAVSNSHEAALKKQTVVFICSPFPYVDGGLSQPCKFSSEFHPRTHVEHVKTFQSLIRSIDKQSRDKTHRCIHIVLPFIPVIIQWRGDRSRAFIDNDFKNCPSAVDTFWGQLQFGAYEYVMNGSWRLLVSHDMSYTWLNLRGEKGGVLFWSLLATKKTGGQNRKTTKRKNFQGNPSPEY